MYYKSARLLIIILIGFSCSNTPGTDSFNSLDWKPDKYGCKGDRLELLQELISIKPHLYNLSQEKTIHLLGKPDVQEIYKRSQKFFTYHISGSKFCPTNTKSIVYLQIRFNALGNSNEVIIVK